MIVWFRVVLCHHSTPIVVSDIQSIKNNKATKEMLGRGNQPEMVEIRMWTLFETTFLSVFFWVFLTDHSLRDV